MSPWIKTNASVSTDSPCPDEDRLRELLEERPDASDQALLVGHLDECAPCRDRLQSLAAGADLWSRAARNLRESTADEYGALTGLMARLQTRMLGADETLAPYQPGPTSDFLRPCSTPGRLGCLGPYEIVEILGRGGMGVVYKAVDPALDRTVAIKVLACAPSFSAEARARFRREARAAAAVRSEHAVVIHAVEETAEPPYLVMEFIEGTSLQERLDRSGPLDIDEIVRIGVQIARGLAAAHTQGLIHRDVKPANILLEAGTGKVKITDFGLAKAVDAPSLTQAGTVTGTPEYMAPEQTSDGPIDHRADVFSLGSVLYAMCTGRPPFRAERSLAVLRRTREETPVPIRQLRPEVPEALIAIIERLHRKDPNDRYASAAEVADALDQLQAARAATPLARASGRGAGGEGTLRRRVRWALLAASLLLVAAFSASELSGLTAITTLAVAPVPKDVAQEARVSPAEGLKPDTAVPQPANHEPVLLAAAPPDDAKQPAPKAAPAAAKMAADADDGRPQQITALRLFEGHTGPVSGVAISPDGKRAVSCSGYPQGDATVRLWDVASGKEIRRLNADRLPVLPAHAELENPSGEVWTVAFAPDGRHVLFGGANGLLGLWNVQDGTVARRFVGHKGVVQGVAISRDGKLGLSGGADRTVRLWDMGTGKELQRMMGHTDFVRGVAFSPDGTRALSGSKDHTMRFWDLKKGEQVREPFLGHPDCVVWSMAFLPDGQQAISGDATIRLWDLAKDLPGSRQLRTFDGHTSPIYDVTLSPDGLRILSCSVDRTVRLWDRATGREIATLVGHRNFVQSVAFTPDGRYALSGGGGVPSNPPHQTGNDYALRLWELPQAPAAGATVIEKAAPTKAGQPPAVAGLGKNVRAAPPAAAAPAPTAAPADNNRPQEITASRLFEGHTGAVSMVAISPDGRSAVSCSGRPQGDGTVRLWEIASGKEIRRLNADRLDVLPSHTELVDPPGEILAVAFTPDGRHVLFGGANGVFGLWNVDTAAVVRRFVGHKRFVQSVAVSRDGKLALSAGDDRVVRLWDMSTGKELQQMAGHTDCLRCVAFSPDGTRALSGGRDRTMRLWDLKKGEQIREPFVGQPPYLVRTVAFLPDGQQAISCDLTIRLWDLTRDLPTGRQVRTFEGHKGAVFDVAFSPDGRRIISASDDRTARLWDRFTGREIATLVGHRDWVQSVAFSPDGRYALTGGGGRSTGSSILPGNDFALRLWRLP